MYSVGIIGGGYKPGFLGRKDFLSNIMFFSHLFQGECHMDTVSGVIIGKYRCRLAVRSIGSDSSSNFGLPLVTVGEKLLLVVQQLFTGLGGIFGVGSYATLSVNDSRPT